MQRLLSFKLKNLSEYLHFPSRNNAALFNSLNILIISLDSPAEILKHTLNVEYIYLFNIPYTGRAEIFVYKDQNIISVISVQVSVLLAE